MTAAGPVRVGLVGAGPWAQEFHAPMLAGGPGTSLAGIWARRPDAAQTLAESYGAVAAASFEELVEDCDAVAFAVPPDVQGELAPRAAAAGKHLVLEKPLAFTVADAERIVAAAGAADVRTLVILRNRFTAAGRAFVEAAHRAPARGAQASFITGAALEGSKFATPWRVERGALDDLGPHVLDLLDAAMGRIETVEASGDPTRWLSLVTRHESGAIGQVALSITTPDVPGELSIEVTTDAGQVRFDGAESDAETGVRQALVRAFVEAVETGVDPETNAARGLHLQRLLAQAQR